MTVSMPIDVVLQPDHKAQHLLPTQHGLKIGFLGPAFINEHSVNRRRQLQTAAITGACFRLGTTLTQPEVADINFSFEADLQGLVADPKYSNLTTPIIVLCGEF